MDAAITAMTPASEKLTGQLFQESLQLEQQALQHLLRAESAFRDIQTRISRDGGGGGRGAASPDLASLFDLELDEEQNQDETNAKASGSQQQQAQQKIDDAMKKLEELARRQQDVARQQQQANPQQLARQKYQEEMLRREAEQLRQQMEDLQNGQQGQQDQQPARQNLARNGQNGLSQSQNSQLDQVMRQIQQAERAISDAASSRQQNSAQTAADAQRAADTMKQANQALQNMQKQQASSQMGDLANKAERLANQQHDFERQMRKVLGTGAEKRDEKTAQQLASEEAALRDQFAQIQKGLSSRPTRAMSGSRPDVAKLLRDAAGHAQGADIDQRMQQTEQMIRYGQGQYAVMRQAPVTQGLNQLRDGSEERSTGTYGRQLIINQPALMSNSGSSPGAKRHRGYR